MGIPFRNLSVSSTLFSLCALFAGSAYCQTPGPLFCTALATPVTVRTEGIAEKMGDIQLSCTGGTPGTMITGNLTIALQAPITNRLTPGTTSDLQVTVDTGTGPVPIAFGAQLLNFQTVVLTGISFTSPAGGNVTLRVSNLRASMRPVFAGQPVQAFLALDALSTFALQNNPVSVAIPLAGLFTNATSTLIRCTGSPLPSTISMSTLFAAGTRFESTRLAEGFISAFRAKGPLEDTGTRFLIRYSNVPAGIRLFVPDVIAGSDALQPTAGGDFGQAQAAGQYVPGSNTLLLSRVASADANGAGGAPVYVPGPAGSPAVAFNTASEVPLSNGSGYVAYEVMDANLTVREWAQFPTFVGLQSDSTPVTGTAQESVSFASISTDSTGSSSAPIPRFANLQPSNDCQVVGDCNADYFPRMLVFGQSMQFSAYAGGLPLQPPGYIAVQNPNAANSVLNWTASTVYKSGSGWVTLEPAFGLNNGSVRVWVRPEKLAPGSYLATVIIDGGNLAGSKTLPVGVVVTELTKPPEPVPAPVPPPQPRPGIVSITNGANFLPGPVVAGSIATIKGTRLMGKTVAVTFDGTAAKLLYVSEGQINLLVPAELTVKASAQVVVTVDGVDSPAQVVPLASLAPAIFANGILNQDNGANGESNGAPVGSIIQIYLTGLPANAGIVLVKIHDREDLVPAYADAAPGIAGVQQVNVAIPQDLPAMTTEVVVCGLGATGQKVCSAPSRLTLVERQ
jgi:uncharacterized protein (TIGR03437 family)